MSGSAPETPWLRLDRRMVAVDALRLVLAQLPALVALVVVGVDADTVWPLLGVAAFGAVSAVADLVRWSRTRYRVTAEHVERRTGLFVVRHRSVRRDRIRSVDADARLLRRLAGLRRVTIGAGQVNTAGESALTLDALSLDAALALRRDLLDGAGPPDALATLARFRWTWVFYNMVNVWAYVMAAGLLWGAYWTATMFGADPGGWVGGLADWDALGPWRTALVVLAAVGLLGFLGMAGAYFTEHAHFRLERVPTENGTALRTTQGLLKTREITRDDARLRGVALSEPLLWRWAGVTDTSVITTGLSRWSVAATILPRGPRGVARQVADAVLAEPVSPLAARLAPHPAAARRRRLCWAAAVAAAGALALYWLTATTALPAATWWLGALALLLPGALLAEAGYRALGHAVGGRHLVLRSGAVSRATSVLRRDAVSGVRVRQSLLQRRLGLATVSVSTAAGYGVYTAHDLAAADAAPFAADALPHLAPFLAEPGERPPARDPRGRAAVPQL
ncbi:PH domain-containing protein [Streptomyces sp. TRM70308]|uniref:PH domain-containing protein n=1 Tax=Streptomyces sp. TRM70308 TaxID=3131932 RepID=UPI003D00C0A2